MLGPLTNPAGARAQVVGVYSPHLVPVIADVLAQLDARRAFVGHDLVRQARKRAGLSQPELGERAGTTRSAIGGLAAVAHGSPITTEDVDVTPDRDQANLLRLDEALSRSDP